MAFGVFDPSGLPTGLNVTYTWNVSPNGDPGQCQVPSTCQVGYGQFGPIIVDDSDNRLGYCNLTFNVYAPSNFALDIQYYAGPGGSAGQCVNALPQGQFYTASAGAPITLSLDTDNRPGGCWLTFRLRLLS